MLRAEKRNIFSNFCSHSTFNVSMLNFQILEFLQVWRLISCEDYFWFREASFLYETEPQSDRTYGRKLDCCLSTFLISQRNIPFLSHLATLILSSMVESWSSSLFVFQKFQVEESDVRMALATGDMHDQLLVAYHLILDNRRINAEGK